MIKPVLASAVLLASALAPAAQAASIQGPFFDGSQRPHSTVALRTAHGLAVRALFAEVRRSGSLLKVTARVRASSSSSAPRDAVLRVGRCTGGEQAFQSCKATASTLVHLPARGDNRSTTVVALVHQPPASQDAIEVQLTEPGLQKAPFNTGHGYTPAGDLILRGQAWRGRNAGREYGADTAGPVVTKLYLDVAAVALRGARVGEQLQLRSTGGGTSVQSILSPCGRSQCTPRIRAFTLKDTPATSFFDRPSVARPAGATDLGLTVQLGDSDVGSALLPWPVRLP